MWCVVGVIGWDGVLYERVCRGVQENSRPVGLLHAFYHMNDL